MPTIEDRLRQWQQELLDFSNRNRLLNFRPSTARPSSVELIAPHAVSIHQVLLQGKSLTVVGNDPVDENVEGIADSPEDAIDSELEILEFSCLEQTAVPSRKS